MVSDPAGHAGRQAWLHLVLTPGLGPLTALRLLAALGSPERILSSARTALAALVGPAGAAGAVRFSLGRDTSALAVDMAAARIGGVLAQMAGRPPTLLPGSGDG